jgi:hypothetical protein
MAQYWSALEVISQIAGEIGLPRPTTVVGLYDVQSSQLLALLNSGGNELQLYYPWEQFSKEWAFTTVAAQDEYTLPTDLSYFVDQTQWDNTNRWPLSGPKSAQEWAYIKGSLVAPMPRLRYRIAGDVFKIYPIPTATSSPLSLSMEYVSKNWIAPAIDPLNPVDMISQDSDLLMYNPWLLIKFVKFKFYELKGLPTAGVQGDFMRVFNSLTGKDTGADILSLAGSQSTMYINARSIPDGSWNV